MFITKEAVSTVMFVLMGTTINSDCLTGEDYKILGNLIRQQTMGAIKTHKFKEEFLHEANRVLLREGVIQDPIRVIDEKIHGVVICAN